MHSGQPLADFDQIHTRTDSNFWKWLGAFDDLGKHRQKASPELLRILSYFLWQLRLIVSATFGGIYFRWGAPSDAQAKLIDEKLLATLQSLLRINHEACQESALHGLGHWHLNYPEEVENVINQFLLNFRPSQRACANTPCLHAVGA